MKTAEQIAELIHPGDGPIASERRRSLTEKIKNYARECVKKDRVLIGSDIDTWTYATEQGSIVCMKENLMLLEIRTP